MSIIENKQRIGNFTSSNIAALTTKDRSGNGFGAPALTYIAEKNMERMLGRSIDQESNAKPLTWGRLAEQYVFEEVLGMDYTFNAKDSLVHTEIPYWSGSPDGFKMVGNDKVVMDIKSPHTLKSFCQLVQPLYDDLQGMDAMNAIRNGYAAKNGTKYDKHKSGEQYYWQLVSNAILTGCTKAELIIFAPYQSELSEIRKYAEGVPEYYWITFAQDNELPYLIDGGYYKNINKIEFDVPQEDIELLTAKVKLAGKFLINNGQENELSVLIAEHDREVNATTIQSGNILKI